MVIIYEIIIWRNTQFQFIFIHGDLRTMNLIYLSPHYPAHFSQFVQSLANYGIRVFGVSDTPDEALDPQLRNSLAGHYKVDRLENTQQVLNACDFFQHSFGKMDRVESHLETWTELEAEIRQRLNMFGPKPDDLQFMKRKSKMKKIFTQAKIPSARGEIVKDLKSCKAFINGKYPAFIKPDIGVGAADTYTIKNAEDLENFFKVKQSYDYFIEEYVKGDIESFDGLTDHDGNIVFFTSHIFSNDIHNMVKNNENVWYYSLKEIPADLEKLGKRVVKEAGIKEKFFHIEFFRLADGSLKSLEINMRPPGGLSTHMFNYACNIDVYDWWAAIMAGKESKRDYERLYHCGFVGRKHNRAYKYSHDELYQRWGYKLAHSQPMNPVEYTVMGHWGYLPKTKDKKEMRAIIDDIVAEA